MLFNSIDFIVFLPIIFLLYWFFCDGNARIQNTLLLVASYFFYSCWDYRFLFLLLFSTALDYFAAIKMSDSRKARRKKGILWLTMGVNLAFLGVFKYYNFFSSSFAEALSKIGITADFWTVNVVLPVGISFYTFHGLSYVIDVYKGRIKPETDFVNYSLFVSFFPLLVAGPIERATHLLPQIGQQRSFNHVNAVDGLRQILWGFFKKVVIADGCARYVNQIFDNSSDYTGSTLVFGAILFAFQIYCDFSGYSDIAIGTARLFGINLIRNFAFPYFARDIAEFWRRWHISLSSWFKDYLYIPLGGSRVGPWLKIRNTFIIFLVSGIWHGANWTFVVWGVIHALYFLPLLMLNSNRTNLHVVAYGKMFPSVSESLNIILTFGLVTFAWIFFRAENLTHAFEIVNVVFSSSLFTIPYFPSISTAIPLMLLIPLFLTIEWFGRREQYALATTRHIQFGFIRKASYYSLITLIFFYGNFEKNEFIYFQF
jgi:alginate O-acetyltransferase complex protein AlgI